MASFLLGVSGRKRSGKDTFAQRLVEAHGFTRIAFADALRDVLADMDPYMRGGTRLSDALRWEGGWEGAKLGKDADELRRILQALGVAVRDHVDTDAWVDAALIKAAKVEGPVVITDVRFPNEAQRVQWDGGKIVRIERPSLDSSDTHVSETALDNYPFDRTILNDGTVEDLHAKADALVEDLHLL